MLISNKHEFELSLSNKQTNSANINFGLHPFCFNVYVIQKAKGVEKME